MPDFINNILQSIGTVREVHTLVDFYQYIKSVEYLICLGFFVGFPLLYKKLHGSGKPEHHQQ
jgi:hypothetical protein